MNERKTELPKGVTCYLEETDEAGYRSKKILTGPENKERQEGETIACGMKKGDRPRRKKSDL